MDGVEAITIRCAQGFDSLAGRAGTGYIGQGRRLHELNEVLTEGPLQENIKRHCLPVSW